jgi:hypothetical protein
MKAVTIDTQLGRIFQEALTAELNGDLAWSLVWRRLLFALARDIYGLRVAIKPVFASAIPERRTIMFADDLLDGIRAAIKEPRNKDAQVLPRRWSLAREHDAGLRCTFIYLVAPDGKRTNKIVGIDADLVASLSEIELAIRAAGKYNTATKPPKVKRNDKQFAYQLSLAGV